MKATDSDPALRLPREPIARLVDPVVRFMHVETATGVVLLLAAGAALALANSPWRDTYLGFWETPVLLQVGDYVFGTKPLSLKHLINDGLMVVFFFVIGLEVKREMVLGELRDLKRAALPLAAALGGMAFPAAIYLALQWGQPAQRGWGIPMATDIAFVVGAMAILGRRIPHGLRVMLLSLAIADDIGAILVIAIGYSKGLDWNWLIAAAVGLALVRTLAVLGVRNLLAYTLVGIFVWYATHESGIHATIAGVILGLMTPARSYLSPEFFQRAMARVQYLLSGNWEEEPARTAKVGKVRTLARESVSPLEYLENALHPWVNFAILPVFALANAGVPLQMGEAGLGVAVAVGLGLLLGKPLGIFLFSWVSVKAGLARLPNNVTWGMLLGGGTLAGIGFTMALFIAELALAGDPLNSAKIGILAASLLAAVLGLALLFVLTSRSVPAADADTGDKP